MWVFFFFYKGRSTKVFLYLLSMIQLMIWLTQMKEINNDLICSSYHLITLNYQFKLREKERKTDFGEKWVNIAGLYHAKGANKVRKMIWGLCE